MDAHHPNGDARYQRLAPAWNGAIVAAAIDGGVAVRGHDGGEQRWLVGATAALAWAPGGRALAVVGERLRVLGLATAEVGDWGALPADRAQVCRLDGLQASAVWSPAGTRLAIACGADRRGLDAVIGFGTAAPPTVVAFPPGELTAVGFLDEAQVVAALRPNGHHGCELYRASLDAPASPASRLAAGEWTHVALASATATSPAGILVERDGRLATVDPTGVARELARDVAYLEAISADAGAALVALPRRGAPGNQLAALDIATGDTTVFDLEGHGARAATHHGWERHGRFVVVAEGSRLWLDAGRPDGAHILYDGGEPGGRLRETGSEASYPRVSPDGHAIAFLRETGLGSPRADDEWRSRVELCVVSVTGVLVDERPIALAEVVHRALR